MASKRATDWPRCPGYGGLLVTIPDLRLNKGLRGGSIFERGRAPYFVTFSQGAI